mgnify:CR=1 FL=1
MSTLKGCNIGSVTLKTKRTRLLFDDVGTKVKKDLIIMSKIKKSKMRWTTLIIVNIFIFRNPIVKTDVDLVPQ